MNPEHCRQIIVSFTVGHSLGHRYIKEAEHQDGDAYWENFSTPEQLLCDFGLWISFEYPEPKVNLNVLFSYCPERDVKHIIELNPDMTCNLMVNHQKVMSGTFYQVRDYYIKEFAPPNIGESMKHLELKL